MAKAAALGWALLGFGLAVGHAHKSALPPARLVRLALPSLVTLLRRLASLGDAEILTKPACGYLVSV